MAPARTFRSVLLRVLLLRVVMFAVLTTTLGITQLVPVQAAALVLETPSPMPSWTATDLRAHPRCVPSASWPEGQPAEVLVVYRFRDQQRHEVAFADAWEDNHNATEVDDVWVLGVCAGSLGMVRPRVTLRP
jgi:hypothetical protein